jgi:hypothetical protein
MTPIGVTGPLQHVDFIEQDLVTPPPIMEGPRAEAQEVDAAGRNLGPNMRQAGFYSYGEISPHALSGICELHNQTMTITTITEEVA